MTDGPGMRRAGFTLLEITIAISMLVVILGIVVNSIVGANRAQGATVAPSLMKVGGQRALKNLYNDVVQSRRLIASPAGTTGTDLPSTYYSLMDIPSVPEPLSAAQRVFPKLSENGGFGAIGSGDGKLDRSTVGNAMMFVEPADPVVFDDNNVYLRPAGGAAHELQAYPFKLPTYRFVLYHMVKVPLQDDSPPINGNGFTYQLIRWESKRYFLFSEINAFYAKLDPSSAPPLMVIPSAIAQVVMQNGLGTRAPDVAGVWDSDQADPTKAFYTQYPLFSSSSGTISASGPGWTYNPSARIERNRQTWVVTTNLTGYAIPMMAFNTSQVPVPGFSVPSYADDSDTIPYGFEAALAGPIGARTVLFRLNLVARLNAGGALFGLAMQDIAKVFDM